MSIRLEQLTRRYGDHAVVQRLSLDIADGESFVLLGPSGSGKSTILRMIAGLVHAHNGRILLHGRDVTNLPPQQRNIGFVFQNYALFRSLSVAENVTFGLRVRKVPPAERKRRCSELLELVGLVGLERRLPTQLSGGQQQRVALARALAYQPDVLLLDEPFGALDARIRGDLRRTVRRIQRELGITSIFVTHDQDEAFELADRIGVMNDGQLLEVGSPHSLYHEPQTEFVAMFLGTANLLLGRQTSSNVEVGSVRFPIPAAQPQTETPQRVQVLFRPENVVLTPPNQNPEAPPLGTATIEHIAFHGAFERLRLRLPPFPGVRVLSPPVPFGSDSVLVEAMRSQEQSQRMPLRVGDTVVASVSRIHILPHPGLHLLLTTDGSTPAQAALLVGSQIARMAHARVTLMGMGADEETLQRHLQTAKEHLGSGISSVETRIVSSAPIEALVSETDMRHHDVMILASTGDLDLIESLLQRSQTHMLLIPAARPALKRVLICVSGGEPDKEHIQFAARFIRHLQAEATLFSVLHTERGEQRSRYQLERFLGSSKRSLEQLGVPSAIKIVEGAPTDAILAEATTGGYDMLVVGAPVAHTSRKSVPTPLVHRLLRSNLSLPMFLVRSAVEGTAQL